MQVNNTSEIWASQQFLLLILFPRLSGETNSCHHSRKKLHACYLVVFTNITSDFVKVNSVKTQLIAPALMHSSPTILTHEFVVHWHFPTGKY